jgi:hypothetical protein
MEGQLIRQNLCKVRLLSPYILVLLLAALSCNVPHNISPKTNRFVSEYRGENIGLTTFDRKSDSVYEFVREDELTDGGWKIQYMIKNDSTRLRDIYIKIAKGNYSRLIRCPDVLEYRSSFLPYYSSETAQYLIFKHWCATDCQALTLVPKDVNAPIQSFESVLVYDDIHQIVVYVNEKSYNGDDFTISAFKFDTGETKSAIFKNKCHSASLVSCIDSISFSSRKVTIRNWFTSEQGEDRAETKTILF